MNKLLTLLGATIGSYAGWAIGKPAGTMTAFIVSMIGTAAGVYAGHRIARGLGGR